MTQALFLIPPSILWLVFLIVGVSIVLCSKQISKYVAAISEKSKLGGAFLGAFVLSFVTSIPEVISGITSSLMGNPTLSYGNVIGVNMMTLTFLAVLDLIFIKKSLFSNVSKTNRTSIIYVFFFNVLMLLCIFIKPLNNALTINLFGLTKFSLVYLFMVIFYIVYIYFIYKKGDSENDEGAESSGCENLSLKTVVLRFFIFAVLLITLSVLISSITDQMAMPVDQQGYGFGSAVAGALFLSICTGLPEMTSALSLAKMGQGNIALGGIIGSHLFNFIIFFIGDFFYFQGGSMQELYNDSQEYLTLKITIIVGMMLNLLLFGSTFKKKTTKRFIYAIPCVIIIALYLTYWITKSNLVTLFS